MIFCQTDVAWSSVRALVHDSVLADLFPAINTAVLRRFIKTTAI